MPCGEQKVDRTIEIRTEDPFTDFPRPVFSWSYGLCDGLFCWARLARVQSAVHRLDGRTGSSYSAGRPCPTEDTMPFSTIAIVCGSWLVLLALPLGWLALSRESGQDRDREDRR